MRPRTLIRTTRAAIGLCVAAGAAGIALSFVGVRDALPHSATVALALCVMWSPFVVLVLYLNAQRDTAGRRAVDIGSGVADGWLYALLLSLPLFYFWRSLAGVASPPFGSSSAAFAAELTMSAVALMRLIRVHHGAAR
jgi:hypothetical protein